MRTGFVLAVLLLSVAQPVCADETSAWDAVASKGRTLLRNGEVAKFDALATQYRTSRERTPGGTWKLAPLYDAARSIGPTDPLDPEWQRLEGIAERWLQQNPDSAAAAIVTAKMHLRHAWGYRGEGDAADIKPANLEPFRAELEKARHALDDHQRSAQLDPEWAAVRIPVARLQGAESQAILDLARDALRREPYYYPIHISATWALQPSWGGSRELILQYVAMALDESREKEGNQAYGRIYFELSQEGDPLDQLNLLGADWNSLRRSLEEINRAYPDPRNLDILQGMACMSWVDADYRTLGRWSERPTRSAASWDTREWRRRCDDWAFEGKVAHGPWQTRLRHYWTYFLGFGPGAWRTIGLLVVGMEAFLWLRVRAPPTADFRMELRLRGSTFEPGRYPRAYRAVSGWPLVGVAIGIRLFIYCTLLVAMLALAPALNAEIEIVMGLLVAVAMLGWGLIRYSERKGVYLQPDAIAIQGLWGTARLLREQISGRALRGAGRSQSIVLVPVKPDGAKLKVGPVAESDDAFWQWFASLHDLDAVHPG